jgi:hypothetical protein
LSEMLEAGATARPAVFAAPSLVATTITMTAAITTATNRNDNLFRFMSTSILLNV